MSRLVAQWGLHYLGCLGWYPKVPEAARDAWGRKETGVPKEILLVMHGGKLVWLYLLYSWVSQFVSACVAGYLLPSLLSR